jgi:hypothetical protein
MKGYTALASSTVHTSFASDLQATRQADTHAAALSILRQSSARLTAPDHTKADKVDAGSTKDAHAKTATP